MKYFVLLVLVCSLGISQTVLFEDDFNDGNADGWWEYGSGADYWVNDSLRYEMYHPGTDTYGMVFRGDSGAAMTRQHYSLLLESIGHSPTTHWGPTLRYDVSSGVAYSFCVGLYWGTYYIGRYDSFADWTRLGDTEEYQGGFSWDTSYWIRFECCVDTLRAKVWEGDEGDEPTNWMIVRYDDNYINNGCISLDGMNYFDNAISVEYDNVVVTEVIITALESSTWGSIKSAFD